MQRLRALNLIGYRQVSLAGERRRGCRLIGEGSGMDAMLTEKDAADATSDGLGPALVRRQSCG